MKAPALSCGCALAVLAFNLVLGTVSAVYVIGDLLGRQVPLWGAALIGLVGGEVLVPLAFVLWGLSWFGIHGPLH